MPPCVGWALVPRCLAASAAAPGATDRAQSWQLGSCCRWRLAVGGSFGGEEGVSTLTDATEAIWEERIKNVRGAYADSCGRLVGALEALVVDKSSGSADGGAVRRGMLVSQTQLQPARDRPRDVPLCPGTARAAQTAATEMPAALSSALELAPDERALVGANRGAKPTASLLTRLSPN